MEKTDEAVAGLIEKLQDAGFTQAPEVIEGTIRAIAWDGTLQLWAGFGFMSLFGIFLAMFIYFLTKDSEDGVFVSFWCWLFSLIIGGLILVLGNPWLKVFDPQAAFYQQVMNGIL